VAHAVDVLEHHARLGHCQLVTFAAHVLQQDGQVQFATAHHFKNAFFVGFLHAQGHVVLQFLLQAVPDLAAGHELAFAPASGLVFTQKFMVSVGSSTFSMGSGAGWRVGHGHADADVFNAVDQHDVAGAGFRAGLHALQALERQHLVDAALDGLAVRPFHDQHVHAWA
jgi:hypothetical protein